MQKRVLLILFVIFLFGPLTISQIAQEWVARYSGAGNFYDRANKVLVDAAGNIFVTGSYAVVYSNTNYITIKYNSAGIQQWAAIYNGPANSHDQSYSMALDNSGHIYVTGGSFGIGTERDFCTIKYDLNGDSIWVKRFNGPGNHLDEAVSIAVDASNNVYVAGYSDGGINLDYCIVKYDTAGTILWTARYDFPAPPPTGSEDRPHDLKLDASGNVYITGESSTGFGFLDMYATVKYNSSGVQQWVSRYRGSGDSGLSQANSLAVDQQGNVYVTGRSDPSSGFGFNFDIATIKYNSSGDSVWVRRYNGPGNSSDIGNAIALDGSGNVIVTGGSVTSGTSNYFTIKYSTAGNVLWSAEYNGPGNSVDLASAMILDNSGNIYVTGFSVGTLRDYATVKYNPSGIQQWVQRYNGPGNNDDEARTIALDAVGNVYISGMSTGSGTGMDLATIKYSIPVSVGQLLSNIPSSYKLYQNFPNPFNPKTNFKLQITNYKVEKVKLVIYDVQGREVETLVNEKLEPGIYDMEFDGTNYASGIYFYSLIAGDNIVDIKKMVLVR